MLIKESATVTPNVTKVLFSGKSQPGETRARNLLKGKPLSRAKAYSCREQVATMLTHPKIAMMTITTDRTVAPAINCVALYRTWMCGCAVGVMITLSTSLIEHQSDCHEDMLVWLTLNIS